MHAGSLKGALAKVNRRGAITQWFGFVLNPEQIHRRMHWPEDGATDTVAELRERLSFKLVLDAVDALERPEGNPGVLEHGIRPQVAALESFIRPSMAGSRRTRSDKGADGRALSPILLFIWGREPAVPVWMVSLNVREELFNAALNPLRASAWVELEVLTPGSNQAAFVASLSRAYIARMHEMVALACTSAPARAKSGSRPESITDGSAA
jgi:hypothetical protein